jgi:signal transduction histidine kinase
LHVLHSATLSDSARHRPLVPVEPLAYFLKSQPRFWLCIEALLLIIAIGFVDYITGPEVSIYPFYTVPILLVFWFGEISLALITAILSAVAWWTVDRAAGHSYSSEWLRTWDAVVRLMLFGLVLFAAWSVKRQRNETRSRIELLERSNQLEEQIIGISEREQERIGRDLHDGVCQYLAAIGFTASMLKQDLQKISQSHADKIEEVANHLRDAAAQVRQLARGLSPVDRDEGGLESALEELAASTSKLTGISCSLVCTGPIPMLDSAAAIHLFRIAQEAVSNSLKHARAQSILIALETGERRCALRISDNGIGFGPVPDQRKGMGLSIMRYRARRMGGELEIQPNSPTGTVVACTIRKEGQLSTWPVSHEQR